MFTCCASQGRRSQSALVQSGGWGSSEEVWRWGDDCPASFAGAVPAASASSLTVCRWSCMNTPPDLTLLKLSACIYHTEKLWDQRQVGFVCFYSSSVGSNTRSELWFLHDGLENWTHLLRVFSGWNQNKRSSNQHSEDQPTSDFQPLNTLCCHNSDTASITYRLPPEHFTIIPYTVYLHIYTVLCVLYVILVILLHLSDSLSHFRNKTWSTNSSLQQKLSSNESRKTFRKYILVDDTCVLLLE